LGKFLCIFTAYVSLHSSPSHEMVFILLFSVAHLGFLVCHLFYTLSNRRGNRQKMVSSLIFWRLELWCWGRGEYLLGQKWKDRVQKAAQLQCRDPETVDTGGTRCVGTYTDLLHRCKFTQLYLTRAVCLSQFSC